MATMLRSARPFTGTLRTSRRTAFQHVRVASRGTSNECSTSGSDNLWWRSLATLDMQKSQPLAATALLVLGLAATADPASAMDLVDAHAHAQPIAELSELDVWSNVVRYGRYFVTVMLGTGYVMLKPLQAALKRPVTAVLAIVALVGLFYGTRTALEMMLGVNEYAYDPDNYRIFTKY